MIETTRSRRAFLRRLRRAGDEYPGTLYEVFPELNQQIFAKSAERSYYVTVSGGSVNIGKIGEGNDDHVTVNDLRPLIEEIAGRRTELVLSTERLSELEGALREVQIQLASQTPDPTVIQQGMKTVRSVIEGTTGSLISSALYPVVVNHWLPVISRFLKTVWR